MPGKPTRQLNLVDSALTRCKNRSRSDIFLENIHKFVDWPDLVDEIKPLTSRRSGYGGLAGVSGGIQRQGFLWFEETGRRVFAAGESIEATLDVPLKPFVYSRLIFCVFCGLLYSDSP